MLLFEMGGGKLKEVKNHLDVFMIYNERIGLYFQKLDVLTNYVQL